MHSEKNVLLLGIGNLLWADEGFGVRVIEALSQWYEFPDHVSLLDGGTQGVYLVQDVCAADVLIVFDAIDYGLPPATMKVIENEDVPKFMGAKKVSLHQTGFQEVLALAEMMGGYPESVFLIGVQPEIIEDYGGSLRPAVKKQIQPAIEKALQYLDGMGISYTKRSEPLKMNKLCSSSPLHIDAYEAGRPSEGEACRQGDDRVLNSDEFVPSEIETEQLGDNPLMVDVDHHLDKYR